MRITPDIISLMRDALFALSTIAAISGLRLPIGHLPIFIVFVFLVVVANFNTLMNTRLVTKMFVPPLFIFICIHLISAFFLSFINGVQYTLQAIAVSLFVLAFVLRYSQVPMDRFLRFTGIGVVLVMIWVVGFHISHHEYVSWKRLNDPKIVFDLLPIMLLVIRKTNNHRSKLIFPFLFFIFSILIMLSGERKAYILLALLCPFMINFRNPLMYVSILVALSAFPILISFEKSGYVVRQLNTLSGFSQGKIERTNSNTERALALSFASRFFLEHPVFGVGTNAYTKYANKLEKGALSTHNDWMRVAAENGIIGLFFYFSTVLYGLIGILKKHSLSRRKGGNEMLIAAAFFTTFLTYLSLEVYQFLTLLAFCFIPFVQYLWLDPNARSVPQRSFPRSTTV